MEEKNSEELWKEYLDLKNKIDKIHEDMRCLTNKTPNGTTLYDFKHKYKDLYKLHKQIALNAKHMFERSQKKYMEFIDQFQKELHITLKKLKTEA